MKWFLVFIAVMVELVAIAQTEPTPLRSVQEGTYFLDGMFQTTILELQGGRFRYWFRSDLRFGKEPSYPLTGTYTTNGGTISFELQLSTRTNPFDKTEKAVFVTERWEFMNYKGQTTLWGTNALGAWKENPTHQPHPVLFPTTRRPEEIWERRK